jgi:hypothetical protein
LNAYLVELPEVTSMDHGSKVGFDRIHKVIDDRVVIATSHSRIRVRTRWMWSFDLVKVAKLGYDS